MLTSELRAKFLEYFSNNDHEVVESSPLIPANDETLLFTNAGMVQFKDVFLGSDKRSYKRATTTQRCIRAGGKHNDLENVGYTLRHHTFFEMLGNFSFGDYFKEEAIQLAWNFLTNELNLEKEKLWISVFREDDEAAEIWLSKIGIDPERIVRLDEEDNFWSMGDTGPCGPCSEIYYDHGEQYEGTPPGSPGDDGDRFVEIWNLVFMQFNRDAAGELTPLPKPSVDTGMGLERVAAVMQGVNSNYETDLFLNLIQASEDAIQSPGAPSHKVIADHIRSVSFLIADGITPSNEGRGYVLRRIMRRAIRHGYKLGAKEPFMHALVKPLVKEMKSAFPMLVSNQKHIEETIYNEENKFLETLDKGIEILEKEIAGMSSKVIPGEIVFKLHDTFGFPFDLTADIAREQDLELDEGGFKKCMEEQIKNSKSASKFKGTQLDLSAIDETQFLGYDRLNAEGKVLGLWNDDLQVDSATPGKEYILALDQSPFYAESGGQVGDQGEFSGSNGSGQVVDCIKQGKIFLHGLKAVELMLDIRSQLQDVQGILNVGAPQVSSKVEDLIKENKSLKKGNKIKDQSSVEIKEVIHKINNFDLVLIEADTQNIQDLRQLVDSSKKGQSERCVLIFSHHDSKLLMVCGVTDDIQESLSAHDVIQTIAKATNGKGGGRKDFAQGAGEAENFKEFVNSIPDIVQSIA